MISRYTRPEMAELWSDARRYELWTRIEVAVCRAMAELGLIPRKAFETIEVRARVDPGRVAEIEARVHHDVNAYLDALAEAIGPAARYVHLGLTSSDVLDTCLALQLRDAAGPRSRAESQGSSRRSGLAPSSTGAPCASVEPMESLRSPPLSA